MWGLVHRGRRQRVEGEDVGDEFGSRVFDDVGPHDLARPSPVGIHISSPSTFEKTVQNLVGRHHLSQVEACHVPLQQAVDRGTVGRYHLPQARGGGLVRALVHAVESGDREPSWLGRKSSGDEFCRVEIAVKVSA